MVADLKRNGVRSGHRERPRGGKHTAEHLEWIGVAGFFTDDPLGMKASFLNG